MSELKKETAKLMFTGDLMAHTKMQRAYYSEESGTFDFSPVFRHMKGVFENADEVVGNLETCISRSSTLSKDKSHLENGKPLMNGPQEFLYALKDCGVTALTMSNNHNTDCGLNGIYETVDAVEKEGFKHTGLYRNSDEKRYLILDVNGIKVGIVSYAFFYNDVSSFSEEEIGEHLAYFSKDRLKKDVADMKKDGAEYIVCCFHCGTEYKFSISRRQLIIDGIMAANGVDYVIGHHPHVVQHKAVRFEGFKLTPVVYSVGNLTTTSKKVRIRESVVVSITLERDSHGKVKLVKNEFIPCYSSNARSEKRPFVIVPKGASAKLDEKYKNVFDETMNQLTRLGFFQERVIDKKALKESL